MNIAAHIEKASPVPGCVAADHPQNNKPESSLVKDQSTSRYYILQKMEEPTFTSLYRLRVIVPLYQQLILNISKESSSLDLKKTQRQDLHCTLHYIM